MCFPQRKSLFRKVFSMKENNKLSKPMTKQHIRKKHHSICFSSAILSGIPPQLTKNEFSNGAVPKTPKIRLARCRSYAILYYLRPPMLSDAVLYHLDPYVRKNFKNMKFDIQKPPRPLPKPFQIQPKSRPTDLLAASRALLATKPKKRS